MLIFRSFIIGIFIIYLYFTIAIQVKYYKMELLDYLILINEILIIGIFMNLVVKEIFK